MTEATLPDGWVVEALGRVASVTMGQSPPSSTYNTSAIGLPFFQGKAEFGDVYPKTQKWCSKPNKTAEAGDILLSVRAPVGPTNLARETCCIGRGLAAIHGGERATTSYLRWFLQYAVGELQRVSTGTTFSAVSGKQVRDLKVPLPLPSEQERIVARIEELMSDVDAGVIGLAASMSATTVFRTAVLAAMWSGGLLGAAGASQWRPMKVADVGNVLTGSTPKTANASYYHGGAIPFYKPSDLDVGLHVRGAASHVTEAGLAAGRGVPAGSVLVTCIGATIGKTGLIHQGGAFNQQINAVIPSEGIDPEWLYFALCSPQFQQQIAENASSTTMPILNKAKFSALRLMVPPIGEQKHLAAFAKDAWESTAALVEDLRVQQERSGLLRQSILKSAFSGQLV